MTNQSVCCETSQMNESENGLIKHKKRCVILCIRQSGEVSVLKMNTHVAVQFVISLATDGFMLLKYGKERVRTRSESPPGSMHHTQSLSLTAYSKKSLSFREHMCLF